LTLFVAANVTAQTREPQAGPDYSAELPHIPPKSPEEAMRTFRLHSGFRIELAACEPNLASPVAVDFDEDGRLYVAEFRDFNQRFSKDPNRQGSIRLLKDEDDDGVYETSTVFLDHVDSPAAVCCFDGGVYIGSAPDILYAKDTDGDGQADIRRNVFTGFGRDVGGEAMFNSFRWSFDNRIHVQTSRSGGEVRRAEQTDARPVSVGARDSCSIRAPRNSNSPVVAASMA
jgi:putative membrane-bound dehydrogenase-like protein